MGPTTGRHAATSWTEGAFLHFALYESNDGSKTTAAQVAFQVADLDLHGNIIELTQPN
ncbi:MAG: hypothetical protein ACI8Y4_001708 [Candidatus Poriferisodalaceae bacterium]|jgi:hypothetical protein